ncbi:ribosomal protein S27-domain-containing protein [Boletus coccyginus]|nr:ribosomal protein S27-domain-containing protein [Boletus coccyginus]
MTLTVDLLNPSAEHEKRQHKLKRLVQSPNSYFMDVKCPGCFAITTVFSHAQSVVLCGSCASVLCQPTGGKARLTEGWAPMTVHPYILLIHTASRVFFPSEELDILTSSLSYTHCRVVNHRVPHDPSPFYHHLENGSSEYWYPLRGPHMSPYVLSLRINVRENLRFVISLRET